MTGDMREALAAEALWRRLTVPEKTRRKLLDDYRSAVRAQLMAELAQPPQAPPTATEADYVAAPPTATEADYVAAWLGEPARDPRVESVPCPLCSAAPGSVCRQPYGPDHWIPASLHRERHEVLAEQILVEALKDMCENPPLSMQFVVGSTPTVLPPAPCTLTDLTALYARLNPPKGNDL
jgi:hypothetical protein